MPQAWLLLQDFMPESLQLSTQNSISLRLLKTFKMLMRSGSAPFLGSLIPGEGFSIHFCEKSHKLQRNDQHSSKASYIRRAFSENDFGLHHDHPPFSPATKNQSRKSSSWSDLLESKGSYSEYCDNNKLEEIDREVAESNSFWNLSMVELSAKHGSVLDGDGRKSWEEITGGGSSGNSSGNVICTGGFGRDESAQLDEHYQSLLVKDSQNSLVLSNYARYLYEVKKNPLAAENYYMRALAVEPDDGETLAQYAKLQWKFFGNKKKAFDCFEKAAQSSPNDCHVLGERASFLWSMEEEEEDEEDADEDKNYLAGRSSTVCGAEQEQSGWENSSFLLAAQG